jgi:hypothetical protein
MPEVSGWTTDTLKELLDIRFNALEGSLTRRFESIESEINERFETQDKATLAALKTVASANEKAEHLAEARADANTVWRNQVSDALAVQRGSEKESSDTWAKWAVVVVSCGTMTTVIVTLLTLFWGH